MKFGGEPTPEPKLVAYRPASGGDKTDFELSSAIKARLRRQLTGVAEDATEWGSIAQCAVARTLFVAVADNIWTDNSWTGVVVGLARQLGSVNPDDREALTQLDAVRPNLQAITMCATALLASAVDDDAIATPARNDRDAVLRTLETGPLALTTDDLHLAPVTTLVHRYAADLPTDARLTSAGIIDTLEHLLSANPLADLADAVAEQWGAVSVEGRDLHLLQQVKNPLACCGLHPRPRLRSHPDYGARHRARGAGHRDLRSPARPHERDTWNRHERGLIYRRGGSIGHSPSRESPHPILARSNSTGHRSHDDKGQRCSRRLNRRDRPFVRCVRPRQRNSPCRTASHGCRRNATQA